MFCMPCQPPRTYASMEPIHRHSISVSDLQGGLTRDKFRGDQVSEAVGAVWVGEVIGPVLDGSFAGDNSLDVEPEHGSHSEAAVLDLLDLELGECIRIVGKTERVDKGASRVEEVALTEGPATVAVGLGEAHEDDLGHENGKRTLGVDKVRVAAVVDALVGEDLCPSLEPDGVVSVSVLGDKLGVQAANRAKHSPACVDHFGAAHLLEGGRVGGETHGVPSVVSRVLTSEVGGDVEAVREWAEPLGAVGAVPLDVAGLLHSGVVELLAGLAHDRSGDLAHAHALSTERLGHSASFGDHGVLGRVHLAGSAEHNGILARDGRAEADGSRALHFHGGTARQGRGAREG
mmetsp:Transcript_7067/g.13917  ORF Transcript_7067/g.13917 Transcript_7067/m.13917 type:complete len:346 (-) Transcript_7067:98-1135(-)